MAATCRKFKPGPGTGNFVMVKARFLGNNGPGAPPAGGKGREMALKLDLPAGLTGTAELVVGEQHTAPRVGSGRIHVLATPVMINLIEAAALEAIEHLLPPGHQSLGTRL